jgi:hypothetical protein
MHLRGQFLVSLEVLCRFLNFKGELDTPDQLEAFLTSTTFLKAGGDDCSLLDALVAEWYDVAEDGERTLKPEHAKPRNAGGKKKKKNAKKASS